ncbi:MAG TPA: hypothetical protein VFE59_06570 [Trebonia sp.]|jgi:hypothetical protein|nr:hypothetical protein [Trebonia sp.]
MPELNPVRLATAQIVVRDDPETAASCGKAAMTCATSCDTGIYAAHLVTDNRSDDRGAF